MYKSTIYITKEKRWNELVDNSNTPDIYFSSEYAKIYEQDYNTDINEAFCGDCHLFFYGNDKEFIIYPFIKREINNLGFMKKMNGKEKYFDIVTPYGYTGMLVKSASENNNKLIKGFIEELNRYCNDNNIVSGFTRFNPVLENHKIFEKHIEICQRNHTIFVDLDKDQAILWAEMNKKTRNLIRKAEKNGISIEMTDNREDLERFAELYLETMKKNQAHNKYFFPKHFFENTVTLLDSNISLFVAKLNNKIISAALFIHKYDYIHYHFSGSDKKYLKYAPNNLLIWRVILWAKEKGYKKMHLGGGSGKDDNLFRFKEGFSKDKKKFCTASTIYIKDEYEKLCYLKDEYKLEDRNPKQEFFPYYRKPC